MRGSASLSDAYRLLRQQKVLRGAWDQADVRGSPLLPPLSTVYAGNRLRTRGGDREVMTLAQFIGVCSWLQLVYMGTSRLG